MTPLLSNTFSWKPLVFLKSSKVQLLSCETHASVFLLFSCVQLDLLVISNGCLNHTLLQPTPPVPLLLWSLCSHCRSVIEVRNGLTFLDLIVTQIEVNYVFILIHVYILFLFFWIVIRSHFQLFCIESQHQVWLQRSTASDEFFQHAWWYTEGEFSSMILLCIFDDFVGPNWMRSLVES